MTFLLSGIGFLLGVLAFLFGTWIAARATAIFEYTSVSRRDDNTGDTCSFVIDVKTSLRSVGVGGAFSSVPWLVSSSPQAIIIFLAMAIMIMIALIDWKEHVIPDVLVLGIVAVGVARLTLGEMTLLDALAGGVCSGLVMLALLWFSNFTRRRPEVPPEPLAWGDVTLMVGLGFLLGLPSAPLFWLIGGFVHILLFALTPQGIQARARGEPLPMAPALCLGATLTLLYQAADARLPW